MVESSLLLAPWFWIGIAIVAVVTVGAWLAGRPRAAPLQPPARAGGRPETRHERAEYIEDPWRH